MKRIISLILIFAMIAGLHAVSASADNNVYDYSLSETLLSDLGIVQKGADTSEELTRGEFSLYLSASLKMSFDSSNGGLPFNDVSTDSNYYSAVYNLYRLNIVSAGDTFRPDDVITSDEALKMVICALGYDFLAKSSGGYPVGYSVAASRLDMDISFEQSKLKRGEGYELLRKMLLCRLPSVTLGNDINYNVNAGETMIYKLWGLNFVEGRVNEAQYFGTDYKNGVGEGFTVIDDVKLRKGSFDTDRLYGEYVEAYYDNQGIIRSLCTSSDSSDILMLYSDDDISFKDNRYTYYDDNDKEKTKAIAKNSIIIYNGRTASYSEDIMIPEKGSIKLISEGSGAAQKVIIYSYNEMVADSVSKYDYTIVDKIPGGGAYRFENENIRVVDQNGQASGFETISAYDVLWIMKYPEDAGYEIQLCRDVITGALTGFSQDGKYVYLDEREYSASDYVANEIQKSCKSGTVIKAYLNPDGEIVYFSFHNDTDSFRTGYMVQTALQSGLGGKISAKILTSEGNLTVYDFAPKFSVNGKAYKDSAASVYDSMPREADLPGSMPVGIIKYQLNSNGEITSIDYSDELADKFGGITSGYFKTSEITDMSDVYVSYKAAGNAIYSKSTQRIFAKQGIARFVVPEPKDTPGARDEDFKVTSLYDGDLSKQSHKGYSLDDGVYDSKYIVSTYSLSDAASMEYVDAQSGVYMVESVSQAVDKDGNVVEKIKSYGKNTELYSKELGQFTKLGLGFGDLIKVNADSYNVVQKLMILYKPDVNPDGIYPDPELVTDSSDSNTKRYKVVDDVTNPSVINANPGMNTISESYAFLGRIYEKDATTIGFVPMRVNPDNPSDIDINRFDMAGRTLKIVNTRTKTVRQAELSDFMTYKDFGDDCHIAFVECVWGYLNSVYVYE